MSSKSKKRPPEHIVLRKAVDNALVMFLWAFISEFSPEFEALERLKKEIYSVRDSVNSGALTIPEIKRALKDDYDWEVR